MATYRYSSWDDSQELFPLQHDEVMDLLSNQLVAKGDVASSLRNLVQHGVNVGSGDRIAGMQELLHRLRAKRQELLEKFNLGSVVSSLKQRLQTVIDTERSGIQSHLDVVGSEAKEHSKDEDVPYERKQELLELLKQQAKKNIEFLDQLPAQVALRLEKLSRYDFMDTDAHKRFLELVGSLQEQLLDAHFKEISWHLLENKGTVPQNFTPFLHDLNQLLEQDSMENKQFQDFMLEYSELFAPNPPKNLTELVKLLQDQRAQMQSLLRSITPEQRAELLGALDAALSDPQLRNEIRRLDTNLEALDPLGGLGKDILFQGHDELTLEQALVILKKIQDIEESERQLLRAQQSIILDGVDGDLLGDLLGEDSLRDFRQLKQLREVLENADYIRRAGSRYELTPKGIRRIGQKALTELFTFIKRDRTGGHSIKNYGTSGEYHDEASKPYEFGDLFEPHLQRTLMNAIARGARIPLEIQLDDFEVHRLEQLSQSATVLMLDLSLSMAMRGNFLAAKKVALAMDNLIRTQFPRDVLSIVGFSTYAREVKPDNLPYLGWDEFDPYTNIQHGLEISQRILSRSSGGTKQIVLISDGEPTAHIEGGQLFSQYPPSPRTVRETLREVKRCTRRGITINTFMLDRNAYLMEFVDQMTRINHGRVFYTSPERLGEYILVDYLSTRRTMLG